MEPPLVTRIAFDPRPLQAVPGTWPAFVRDDVSLLGAAMVYYALLSLGPLLLVLLAALGFAFSFLPAGIDAREHLLYLANTHLGAQFSTTLEPILDSIGHSSATATGIGLLVLLYGSMGAFRHLRKSFRRIWRPDQPDLLPIRRVLKHEAFDFLAAFGLVLAAGALMLLSTVATGIKAMIEAQILQMPVVGDWLSLLISPLTTFIVSFLAFSALYRFLPPAESALARRVARRAAGGTAVGGAQAPAGVLPGGIRRGQRLWPDRHRAGADDLGLRHVPGRFSGS